MQSSRERLASLGIQISPIPDRDNHPQVPLPQAPADPFSVPGPADQRKQQNLDAADEARAWTAAADEAMPQAPAADEAMPQAASQVPAVHNQSTSPDAESSPRLGQPGVVEGGASGPDLAVMPACDQPMAEIQDDKSADLPLGEDAHSDSGGLSKSSMAPAGIADIPKQPQARAAPNGLTKLDSLAGAAIDSPLLVAPDPAGAASSSPALPGLSSSSTSPRTQPPPPTSSNTPAGGIARWLCQRNAHSRARVAYKGPPAKAPESCCGPCLIFL